MEDAFPAIKGKQKICKFKGSEEAQISQLECQGTDAGPSLDRVVKFNIDQIMIKLASM